MSQPHKICPRCQRPADLQAPQCDGCGRVYKTQFPQNPDQTVLGAPGHQPHQGPSPQLHNQQVHVHITAPPPPPQPLPPPSVYYQPQGDYIQLPPGFHSPGTAVLLSLLITGVGQMYNKQITKGVVVLVATIIIALGTAGFGVVPCWIIAAIDAFKIGDRLRAGEAVSQWQWF